MATVGGIIVGQVFEELDQNGRKRLVMPMAICTGIVTDKVTGKPTVTKKGRKDKIAFRIRLKRGMFVFCNVDMENDPVAYWECFRLEKDCRVTVMGDIRVHKYLTKKGEEKVRRDLSVKTVLKIDNPNEITPDPKLKEDVMFSISEEEPDDNDDLSSLVNPYGSDSYHSLF